MLPFLPSLVEKENYIQQMTSAVVAVANTVRHADCCRRLKIIFVSLFLQSKEFCVILLNLEPSDSLSDPAQVLSEGILHSLENYVDDLRGCLDEITEYEPYKSHLASTTTMLSLNSMHLCFQSSLEGSERLLRDAASVVAQPTEDSPL